MLHLVSLAHRIPCIETSHSGLQTGAPGAKWLLGRFSWEGCVQKLCTRLCSARWWQWGVCRDSAPCTRLDALEPQQPSCPAQREPCPIPALQEALKAAPPTCLRRGSAPELELAPLRSPTQEGKFPLLLHPTWSHSIGWSDVRQENRCWGPAQKC